MESISISDSFPYKSSTFFMIYMFSISNWESFSFRKWITLVCCSIFFPESWTSLCNESVNIRSRSLSWVASAFSSSIFRDLISSCIIFRSLEYIYLSFSNWEDTSLCPLHFSQTFLSLILLYFLDNFDSYFLT